VVGESGLFWAAVADRLAGPADLSPEDRAALDAALFRPVARIREGVALAEAGGVTACMDASDGVAAGLFGLAASSRVDLIIEPDGFAPHPAVVRAAAALGVDPLKFVLAWGNWELVLTVVPERVRSVRATVEDLGTSFREVGEVCAGGGRVWLEQHGTRAPMTDFSSERFHPTSLFTHGVESYWVFLRDAPLTGGTAAGG
jgi:thiamine monophosphate kinase